MKKLLIGIIVVLIIVLGIGGYFLINKKFVEQTKVAYGYSVKDTEIEAVAEAVSMIKAKLENPDYVILFSTVKDNTLGMSGYDPGTVLQEINRLLPNTKVYGGTSQSAVMVKDGYIKGKNASLALLAVSSPKIVFGVGGADINDFPSAKEAGRAAIQKALQNAGREGEYPQIVLMTGSLPNEEKLISGIQDVIGWGIPIIGGTAGSSMALDPIWKEFANQESYSNGVSLTAIFTDLKIGYAFEAGYERQEEKGIVTKAEGRLIYEIDNKPAAEVFNGWCKGCMAQKLETGGMTVPMSSNWSLTKSIKSESGTYYLALAAVGVGQNKSLITMADIMTGDEVYLTHGNPQVLVDKMRATSQAAMSSKNIAKGKPIFGVSVSCAGLQLVTPEEDRSKLPLAISEEIGTEVPFIGVFANGEQGPLGLVNYNGNMIDSIIVFSE